MRARRGDGRRLAVYPLENYPLARRARRGGRFVGPEKSLGLRSVPLLVLVLVLVLFFVLFLLLFLLLLLLFLLHLLLLLFLLLLPLLLFCAFFCHHQA